MPLPILYRSGSRVLEEVRVVGGEPTAWTVTLPPGDWTVEIDPEHWVLGAVEAQTIIPTARPLIVRPNPSSQGFTLTAAQGGAGAVPGVFTVHDVQGREVRRLELKRLRARSRFSGTAAPPTGLAPRRVSTSAASLSALIATESGW
jgi:hypothetical protein